MATSRHILEGGSFYVINVIIHEILSVFLPTLDFEDSVGVVCTYSGREFNSDMVSTICNRTIVFFAR